MSVGAVDADDDRDRAECHVLKCDLVESPCKGERSSSGQHLALRAVVGEAVGVAKSGREGDRDAPLSPKVAHRRRVRPAVARAPSSAGRAVRAYEGRTRQFAVAPAGTTRSVAAEPTGRLTLSDEKERARRLGDCSTQTSDATSGGPTKSGTHRVCHRPERSETPSLPRYPLASQGQCFRHQRT